MILVTIGLPGAGKGAIARKLKSFFNFEILATGELMRDEVTGHTELGEKIKAHVLDGTFVEDEIAIAMVKDHIKTNRDLIIDGFPRNKNQALAFEKILEDEGLRIDAVLYFDITEAQMQQRLEGRRVCPSCHGVYHATNFPSKDGVNCDRCGTPLELRMDDLPQLISQKIAAFNQETLPLVDYYNDLGLLKIVDANRATMDMYYQVLETSQKFTNRDF